MMVHSNLCGWNTVNCVVSANGPAEDADLLLGFTPLPVEKTRYSMLSLSMDRICLYCDDPIDLINPIKSIKPIKQDKLIERIKPVKTSEVQEEWNDVAELCEAVLAKQQNMKLPDIIWDEIEMFAILETIVKYNYNCEKAGMILDLCDKTLYNKLRKYKDNNYPGEL